ncbi:NAD(P)H-binding protein [Lacticaseibacillus suibinensis]|uniref:NAD(P)H-binding protein n=1 Tax=Lacticaseibacillus suibinensis TaxID=2486011 RepID=UPI000F7A0B24|nr:NAD(P)H-binding protein [Lacticaseibacillus suibinensis]
MSKILILGAHGATAQIVIDRLLAETQADLVLYLRHAARLNRYQTNPRVTLIEGNAQDVSALTAAMADVDVVYSNLGGVQLATFTQAIIAAMRATGRTRLIFYSALGALHEVPGQFGQWNEQAIKAYLPGFRESAKLLAAQPEINATQLRPAWLTDKDEIDYELTGAGEPFKGTEVSRQSVADFIVKLIKNPSLYPHDSLGLNKPHSDGDQPAWL